MQMEKRPCVYILTNKPNGVLYIGVTSDLPARIWQHKNKVVKGFTKKYGLDKLVWYETHEEMLPAIQREKALKSWKRQWKINAREEVNPSWRDLYLELF
jgi:putative endonuclease